MPYEKVGVAMDGFDGTAMRTLLDEQAALRRVAMLVASAGDPSRVFSTVTAEVGGLLEAQTSNMVRFRHDGTADVIGGWNEPGVPSVPVGARVELDGETLAPRIWRSGLPERVDDYAGLTGVLAQRLLALGIRSGVGAPIAFDGELWGAVVVSSVTAQAFAPGASRSPTTASAAPITAKAPVCSGSRIASRHSEGASTSRARRGRARRFAPTSRSPGSRQPSEVP